MSDEFVIFGRISACSILKRYVSRFSADTGPPDRNLKILFITINGP